MALSNRFILNQDRRVVMTQTPRSSCGAMADRLIEADRAIALYRKWHERQLRAAGATHTVGAMIEP
jgi:hypothetical protein